MSSTPCPAEDFSISMIVQGLNMLLIGAFFSAFLVPVAIALFFFSDANLRRRPVFILNVGAILLGLLFEGVCLHVVVHILSLQSINPAWIPPIVYSYFLIFISVDSILVLRLFAMYPPRQLPLFRRIMIYLPVAALEITRVICASYGVWRREQEVSTCHSPFALAQRAWESPFVKAELCMQLVGNTYVSVLFLGRLHTTVKMHLGQPAGGFGAAEVIIVRSSYSERIRTFFWIALSNFVFPVMLNVVLLVLVFTDHNFFHGIYVVTVNVYVTIIGVLIATIWPSSSRWDGGKEELEMVGRRRETSIGGFQRPRAVTVSHEATSTVDESFPNAFGPGLGTEEAFEMGKTFSIAGSGENSDTEGS